MYRVGVTGGPGSGKSTFCKLFAECTPKSEIISVDKIMYAKMREYGSDFEKIFGEPPRYDKEGDLDLDYLTMYDGRVSKALEIIEAPIDKSVCQKIEELAKLNKKFTVIDSSILPILKTWQECEKRIIVFADAKLRIDRLVKRETKGFSNEYYRNLVNGVTVNPNDIGHDVLIQNDGEIGDFSKAVKEISENIQKEIELYG